MCLVVGSIGRSVGGDTLFLSASYSVQEEEEERKTTRKLEATADINMVTTYTFSYFSFVLVMMKESSHLDISSFCCRRYWH